MKNKTYLKLTRISILLFITLISCSKDGDGVVNNNTNSSALFDKWWYDSADYASDLYFNSNGQFQQRVILLGNELTTTGDWVWEDESSGIMKVNNLQGSAQLLPEIWFRISDIQENSMTIQQSVDGNDFSIEVFYEDVNE